MRVLNGLKLSLSIILIAGLVFSGGVFSMLMYAKMTGSNLGILVPRAVDQSYAAEMIDGADQQDQTQTAVGSLKQQEKQTEDGTSAARPDAVILSAPVIRQNPELPAGCEITSLAMLLQYYGISKNKLDLVSEMKTDPTPIRFDRNGAIEYWGNPNVGFVGDVTRKKIGFGIYHAGIYPLLHKYIPSAEDLTGQTYEKLEEQIIKGFPVMVWTTINFQTPKKWVEWDTPIGPIRTTFSEHAVLLTGFDRQYVFVNDPLSGQKNLKIEKKQFIATWESLGKQALSYTGKASDKSINE